MDFTTSITVGNKSVRLDVPKGTVAWRKANSVFCPLGPGFTKAHLLLTKGDVDELVSENGSGGSVSLVWTQVAVPASENKTLTFPGLYLVSSERILFGGDGDENSLHLCEFADSRYLAARRGLDSSQSSALIVNFRSYANNSEYLTGTSGYTWTSMLTALWDACGSLGAWPGLPAALPIDGVPENTYWVGLNAYVSLCSVLEHLDCAIKHNPLTNTYTIVQLGEAQTVATHTPRLKWNASSPDRTGFQCADTLRIYFHYHYKGYGQERDKELANNWMYNGAGDVKTVATGILGASGTKPLWDDLFWQLGENDTAGSAAQNNTALNTRRDNRNSRYVSRYTVPPAHKIFSGLIDDILPGGKVRAVLWRNWSDGEASDTTDNPIGGTSTEYISGVDLVTDLGTTSTSGPAWFDSKVAPPNYEHYAPADLARRSYPTYPRLPEIVQINASGASAGDTVTPNAGGFHKGRVRRWTANAMATLDDCWIRFVDTHDTLAGQVNGVQGEFYGPARLSGLSTSGGTTYPVYTVRKGNDGDNLTQFRLTANLSTGGSAAAVKRVFNGAAYADGAAIVVFDWYGVSQGGRGMFQGVTNMEGVAIKRATPLSSGVEEYDIVWMEQYAFAVDFTLTSQFNGSLQASATVDDSWEQGVSPGATITVNDDLGIFTDCVTGCKGTAIRSEYADPNTPGTPYYKVISCQRVMLFAHFFLENEMCGTDPIFSTITQEFLGEFTFAITPADVALYGNTLNSHSHYGQIGDLVTVKRSTNFPPFDFEVIDVDKKEQDVVTAIEWDADSKCLRKKHRKLGVESCEDESDWVTIVCAEPC